MSARDRGPLAVRIRFCLSYRWLTKEGLDFVRQGWLTPLPPVLQPGQEAIVKCRVKTPRTTGEYWLEFDVLRRHVGWFEDDGSKAARLLCRVEGRVSTGYDDYLTLWNNSDLSPLPSPPTKGSS